MTMLTQVIVDGIDITSYLINYTIENTYGFATNEADIKILKSVSAVLSISTGQTITIYRGWTIPTEEKVFEGYVESFEPEGGTIDIVGKDKMWDLVRKEVTHTYDSTIDASAGVISEIFKDLVITYGGLNADVTSIQSSGSAITLGKFVCNHTDIFERCKALNKILDWQFYYRSDTDLVYFESKGFTSNTTVLTIGDNVYNVPKWTYDNTEMVNDLTVVGAYQEIEATESGRIGTTSGYNPSDIAINFEPISVKMYMDASNPPTTLRVGGLPDSTSVYYYYVDKNQKKIYPAVGTSFFPTDYAEIRYSHAVPIPIHMYSQASIDSYGQFKKTITYKDLRSVADAEQRGTNYLLKYSTPFILCFLSVFYNNRYREPTFYHDS